MALMEDALVRLRQHDDARATDPYATAKPLPSRESLTGTRFQPGDKVIEIATGKTAVVVAARHTVTLSPSSGGTTR